MPDQNTGFTLQYQPRIFAEDRVCIGVDEKGLLQFVQAQVTDKTGDIIVSIAKLAGRLTGPGALQWLA